MSTKLHFPKRDTTKKDTRINPNNPLYTAAAWLAHKSLEHKNEQKTQDLVGMLLTHGARAWRMSQPRSVISLKSQNPNGFSSLRLKV
ncbi:MULTISPECIES: hypothetical protein [unclassified Lentilitoribacter]|uniref:hypothetical protein n=1 Tax=unclassified Lentilitoribacter TaxID=2647570 RepID=UPI001FCEC9A1|nr:hypothetical protein [Lentilitoribacter sp. Alg239-R112]